MPYLALRSERLKYRDSKQSAADINLGAAILRVTRNARPGKKTAGPPVWRRSRKADGAPLSMFVMAK